MVKLSTNPVLVNLAVALAATEKRRASARKAAATRSLRKALRPAIRTLFAPAPIFRAAR